MLIQLLQIAKTVDQRLILLRRADRDPQELGDPLILEVAHDHALLTQFGRQTRRIVLRLPDEDEVRGQGQHLKALGLQLSEVILIIDGEPAGDGRKSMNQVARIKPTDKVTIQVMRNGKELKLTAEIGLRPPPAPVKEKEE